MDDNQDNNETTSGDAKQKTYFVCNVESAVLVSALSGKMVGNVLKSYMGAFMSAEIFAEILKKAGHIVRMGGGKFANRTGSKSPPSR